MARKILSVILALALMCTLLPGLSIGAKAAEPVNYTLFLDAGKAYKDSAAAGNELTLNVDALQGLTYDGDRGVWVMDGFHFTTTASAGVRFAQNTTIEASNENSISVNPSDSPNVTAYGVRADKSSTLTVCGSGTLEVSIGSLSDRKIVSVYGIYADAKAESGTLNVRIGDVTASTMAAIIGIKGALTLDSEQKKTNPTVSVSIGTVQSGSLATSTAVNYDTTIYSGKLTANVGSVTAANVIVNGIVGKLALLGESEPEVNISIGAVKAETGTANVFGVASATEVQAGSLYISAAVEEDQQISAVKAATVYGVNGNLSVSGGSAELCVGDVEGDAASSVIKPAKGTLSAFYQGEAGIAFAGINSDGSFASSSDVVVNPDTGAITFEGVYTSTYPKFVTVNNGVPVQVLSKLDADMDLNGSALKLAGTTTEYTLEECDEGFRVRLGEKYVKLDNDRSVVFAESDNDATVWKYDGGLYRLVPSASRYTGWFHSPRMTRYYLAVDNDGGLYVQLKYTSALAEYRIRVLDGLPVLKYTDSVSQVLWFTRHTYAFEIGNLPENTSVAYSVGYKWSVGDTFSVRYLPEIVEIRVTTEDGTVTQWQAKLVDNAYKMSLVR